MGCNPWWSRHLFKKLICKDDRTDLDGVWEILRPANDESRGHLVSVWVQLVLLSKRNSAWLSMPGWQKPSVQQTLSILLCPWHWSHFNVQVTLSPWGKVDQIKAVLPLKTASLEMETVRITLLLAWYFLLGSEKSWITKQFCFEFLISCPEPFSYYSYSILKRGIHLQRFTWCLLSARQWTSHCEDIDDKDLIAPWRGWSSEGGRTCQQTLWESTAAGNEKSRMWQRFEVLGE